MKIGSNIELSSNITLTLARPDDVDQIIKIYQQIYGKSYPISYGNDPELLAHAISSPDTHEVWIALDHGKNKVGGCLILEKDLFNRIGKYLGLVVLPEYRNLKIGFHLVAHITKLQLETRNDLNSLYATTRTINVGPQIVFFKNDFLPLGIFPNAHRLRRYETVTLFAKFRDGLLEKRKVATGVSPKLIPLYSILKKLVPGLNIPPVNHLDLEEPNIEGDWEFEVIQAENFVKRKFTEAFPDPADRFYPFHSPNILVSEKKGRVEIFAYFSKRDGYCTIIKATNPIFHLHGQITGLYLQLHDIGVTYMEMLINAKAKRSIETLLKGNFLPSAIYPAMRQGDEELEDYIVMSRTMEPLNFKGMTFALQFKPYIDQYVELWKKLNLDTLDIVGKKE